MSADRTPRHPETGASDTPTLRRRQRPTVLIVEDDAPVARVIEQALVAHGYECLVAGVAEDALQILMHISFDLAVVDIFMRGQGGLVAIQAIRRRYPDCRIIATSGGWSAMTPAEALRAAWKIGADETLPKPFRLESLLAMARKHAPVG